MKHNFFMDLFLNPSLQYAVICGFLASIAAGTMGSYVVTKKITSISGSISHSILGGIGIAIFLNHKFSFFIDPIYGAFVFAIISALVIGWLHIKHKEKEDSAISSIWAIGMGIGIIFISFIHSHTHSDDFLHFLFGDILSVTKENVYILLSLNTFILISIALFYKKFLLICFDEESAKIQNISVNKNYLFLLILIALSVVVIVKTVGIILLIALLSIPPSIAKRKVKKISHMMGFSIIYSSIFIFIGIAISYQFKLPPGGVIAILSAIYYFISIKKKAIN